MRERGDLGVGGGGHVEMWEALLTYVWGLWLASHQTCSSALYIIIQPSLQVWSGSVRHVLVWALTATGGEVRWGCESERSLWKLLEGRNTGQHVQTQAKKDEVLQRVRGAASNGATKESRKNLEDLWTLHQWPSGQKHESYINTL